MMLLLGRLISFLPLLLRLLVKISFSLLRRLRFLTLVSVRRFVGRRREAAVVSMLSMRKRRITTLAVHRRGKWRFAVVLQLTIALAEITQCKF
ncbi:hypothetical protein ANAPH1_00545 [Anaplasma phagocytophilum]|nr:hypothetical protein ANAPH1_00545 [Anaplasma phagocytophilum]